MTFVRSWLEDGIGRIHLDDAARRNAFTHEMSSELTDAVAAVVAEGAGAIVLTAEAPVFCSGGLLEDLITPRAPLHEIYRGFVALADAPVPTIAVVTGAAVGAGVNLPLMCDVVIAGRSATFDPRFLDVGIHPGGGHLWRLLQRVGYQGAAALSLCGDSLTGEEAERAGLAWRCVDDDQAVGLALKLARRATGRDHELVARTKATLRETAGILDPMVAMDREREAQQWSMERPEFAAGIRAIQEQLAARKK